MSQDLEHLKDWIGKTEEIEDRVTQFQVHGLRALFDDPTVPQEGDPCGPMDHWCFFNPRVPKSQIGADGHPKRGGFMPPVPLPRRMFGGCRATHHQPFIVGERVHRKNTISDVVIKPGRTGTLVICTVTVEMSGQNGLAITEAQDIIYRDNPPADAKDGAVGKTNPAPSDHDYIRTIEPDPVSMFRYSAVTFNGHRIHYDRKYVTEVEGYPGLIVHGPLTASYMLYQAMEKNPGTRVTQFDFQARAPLFDIAPFQVAGKANADGTHSLWSITPQGTVGTLATVAFG